MTETLQYLGELYLGFDLSLRIGIPLLLAGLVCGVVARLGGEEYRRFRLCFYVLMSAGLLVLFGDVIMWLLVRLASAILEPLAWLMLLLANALLDAAIWLLKAILQQLWTIYLEFDVRKKIGIPMFIAGAACGYVARQDEEQHKGFRLACYLLVATAVLLSYGPEFIEFVSELHLWLSQ